MKKTFIFLPALLLILSSCNNGSNVSSGYSSGYQISGTASGLSTGEQAVLVNNNDLSDKVVLTSESPNFTFKNKIPHGGKYNVTILKQPSSLKLSNELTNKICTIKNYGGSGLNKDITEINILCSNESFKVSGHVFGLIGNETVSIINNGDSTDNVLISKNGVFTFPHKIARNASYNVTIDKQPLNEICSVNNGSAAGINEDVSNVIIICSKSRYSVGGYINQLAGNQSLTLVNNGDVNNSVTLMGDSPTMPFNFPTPLAHGGNYNVTVGTQPENQFCTVNNGEGFGLTKSVHDINVKCSQATVKVSGSVTGLTSGQTLTLVNNGDINGSITLSGSGDSSIPFTFYNPQYTSYNVKVGTQPENETCQVIQGKGFVENKGVNNIQIKCTKDGYTVSVTLNPFIELNGSANVNFTNHNQNSNDSYTLPTYTGGSYTFPKKIPYGDSYNVIAVPGELWWGGVPLTVQCDLTNNTGKITENVTIEVHCHL